MAWNEAIKAIFKEFFPEQSTLMPMITYAIIVTVIAVIVTFVIARAISKAKERSSKPSL